MKNKILIGMILVVILSVNIFSISKSNVNGTTLISIMQNAIADPEGTEGPDCSDPTIPRLSCPIWTVVVTLGIPPSVECTTGGRYICALAW